MAKRISMPLSVDHNQLNWNIFNFLENLLVFCSIPKRRAPKESGVQFKISSQAQDQAINLLFQIDRQQDPLVSVNDIKPDYMAIYLKDEKCICTIIEMKGKGGLKHGVEQIIQFRDRIKKELQDHEISRKWTITYQGLLLTPPNSDIPRKRIAEEQRKGFVILPLQYYESFEIFHYISKRNASTEKYDVRQRRKEEDCGFMELLLTQRALRERIHDKFLEVHKATLKKYGVYVNFLHPEHNDEYIVLYAKGHHGGIGVKADNEEFIERIRQGLNKVGLQVNLENIS